jgi:hypothetical protein
MSALRSFDITQAPGSGATVQVPQSFQPELDRTLLDGSPRVLEFPASAGAFTPNILSQILVPPTANRYILGGTSYLQFRVKVSASVVRTGDLAAQMIYFTGGPTKSAASLIDRLTISAAGTTLVDINNYAIWHNIILAHAANQDYLLTSQIQENAFMAVSNVAAGTGAGTAAPEATLDISLPLAVGLLNTTKAFPLWAFNGPLVINIYWASFERAVGIAPCVLSATDASSTSPSSFSGTFAGESLALRCSCVDVDPEYIMEQRRQMSGGKMLMYSFDQAMGLQTNAGSTSINFGINCSSLLAVFGAQLMAADAKPIATSPAEGAGSSFEGSWGYSANEANNIRVYRDGTQMTSFPLFLQQRDEAFPILQQALGILFSTTNNTICQKVRSGSNLSGDKGNFRLNSNVTSVTKFNHLPIWSLGASRGGSVYQPAAVVWGMSARKCNDDSISNQGIYCQQLQFTMDAGQSQSGTHYLFYVFSSAVAIDGGGNCVVKR